MELYQIRLSVVSSKKDAVCLIFAWMFVSKTIKIIKKKQNY
jgi:hypothetical protein